MSALKPKGEKVRQAIKWISELLKEDEKRSIPSLILRASEKFNLSPKDEEFVRSFYSEKQE